MITFPAPYVVNPQNFVQGPTLAYWSPMTIAGADPAANAINFLGLVDKNGFEFEPKPTYSETDSDEFTVPVEAFMTKQEYSFKVTLQEVGPANLNLALGLPASSLVNTSGIQFVQGLGEPIDVLNGTNPQMRAIYRQLIFRFPSTGHDNTTTPTGAWGYYQAYKAFLTPGSIKYSKETLATVALTVKCLTDYTVAGPSKVGKTAYQ